MNIVDHKTDFRDLLYNSLQALYYFLSANLTIQIIIDKLDASFINKLFDIQEKYVEDFELERVIKNILRILCLHSEILSIQISDYY